MMSSRPWSSEFGATFRKKSWNHCGYNNLSPIETIPVGQVLWQGYRVWDRSGEYSPWGPTRDTLPPTPPPPEGWLETVASNFCRGPLENEIRRVRSLYVGTSEKFVRRVKILWASLKKNRTPPPIWKPVILRGGVWIKMECPLDRNANDP